MKKTSTRFIVLAGILLLLAGCAARADRHGNVEVEIYSLGYPPPGYSTIPAGHLPPPGECRFWYPDRPAGHQPPPGRCDELRYYDIPPGAFLIRG